LVKRNLNVAIGPFEKGAGNSRLDTVAMLVELFLERNQIVFVTHLCELGGAVLLLVGPAFKRRQVNPTGCCWESCEVILAQAGRAYRAKARGIAGRMLRGAGRRRQSKAATATRYQRCKCCNKWAASQQQAGTTGAERQQRSPHTESTVTPHQLKTIYKTKRLLHSSYP
jgi:hypothetical protein